MKAVYWAALAMLVASVMGATAQTLFKKANVEFNLSGLTNWVLWLGIGLYGLAFIINLVAYKYGEASRLYAVIAFSYVWLGLFAWWFLGEQYTLQKGIGSLVIVTGVLLMFF